MNKSELMQIIKEYLLFNINYKYTNRGYCSNRPYMFYRRLRQWANIHKVSILTEVASEAVFVKRGEFMRAKDAQIILTKNYE